MRSVPRSSILLVWVFGGGSRYERWTGNCSHTQIPLTPQLLKLITRLAFSTPPCSRTPSSDRQQLDCRQHDEQPSLRCLPLNNLDSQESGVECEWLGLDAKELVGFRTALTSSRSSSANISIVTANVRQIRYERLEDGTDYRLKVQVNKPTSLP